jgi:hypothetical protein
MGRSVVRAVGYIERPRESLMVVLEPSEDSVMHLVKQQRRLNAEFTVCTARPLLLLPPKAFNSSEAICLRLAALYCARICPLMKVVYVIRA